MLTATMLNKQQLREKMAKNS